VTKIRKLRLKRCDHVLLRLCAIALALRRSEPKKLKKFFGSVSGLDRYRSYTYEEKSVSDEWIAIGLGGTADEFLGEMIEQYREMMFRAARAITYVQRQLLLCGQRF
jgi:hypothetical protein